MMDFEKTPSFYNNPDYFQKYLGSTSYYIALQNALISCIDKTSPKQVLELGCALGTTTFFAADIFEDVNFCGIDIRNNMINEANKKQEARDFMGHDNATFIQADMTEFVRADKIKDYSFFFMLYSFHHIPDPEDNKIEFIKNIYSNMSPGTYLWIGETFLPEDEQKIEDLWALRALEGQASTFWEFWADMSTEKAKTIAELSYNEERKAGECVAKRNNEYLVTRSWLARQLQETEFKIQISEPVNAIGDGVILAKKDS